MVDAPGGPERTPRSAVAVSRVRAGLNRGREMLGLEWREGRLSLSGLSRSTRIVAALAIGVALAACAVVVLTGARVELPGGNVDVPGRFFGEPEPVAMSRLVIVFLLVGLAVAAAALVRAALPPEARFARLTLLAVALVGAAFAASALGSRGAVSILEGVGGASPLVAPSAVALVTGCVGLACVVPLAVLPRTVLRRAVPLTMVLAAAPFVAGLVAFLILGAVSGSVGLEALLSSPDYPTVLSAQAILAPPIYTVTASVSQFGAPLAIWQSINWARASRRELGVRAARLTTRTGWFLAALIGAKVAWLLAGYLGRLPDALGGASSVWSASLADGPIGWLIGLAFAVAAGWWLLQRERLRVSEDGFARAALGLALGFAAWSIAMGVLGLLTNLAAAVPTAPPPALSACGDRWSSAGVTYALICVQDLLTDALVPTQIATILAAGVVGGVLLARGRHRTMAIFLLAAAAWALPRAVNAAVGGAFPTVDLATLDTAVTVVVVALALRWPRPDGRRVDPAALTLVLVVSTLLAHASTLIQPEWSTGVFYLALVFPLLYEIGFDSEDLNADRADRPIRLCAAPVCGPAFSRCSRQASRSDS